MEIVSILSKRTYARRRWCANCDCRSWCPLASPGRRVPRCELISFLAFFVVVSLILDAAWPTKNAPLDASRYQQNYQDNYNQPKDADTTQTTEAVPPGGMTVVPAPPE